MPKSKKKETFADKILKQRMSKEASDMERLEESKRKAEAKIDFLHSFIWNSLVRDWLINERDEAEVKKVKDILSKCAKFISWQLWIDMFEAETKYLKLQKDYYDILLDPSIIEDKKEEETREKKDDH